MSTPNPTLELALDDVHTHLAQIDTSRLTASLVPPEFCDVDYPELNGIEGSSYVDDPTGWDFVRFAEAG